jgi:hypothetical protein
MRHEYDWDNIKRPIAMVNTRMNGFLSVAESTCIAQTLSERDVTANRTKKFASRKLLNYEHHAPVHV